MPTNCTIANVSLLNLIGFFTKSPARNSFNSAKITEPNCDATLSSLEYGIKPPLLRDGMKSGLIAFYGLDGQKENPAKSENAKSGAK